MIHGVFVHIERKWELKAETDKDADKQHAVLLRMADMCMPSVMVVEELDKWFKMWESYVSWPERYLCTSGTDRNILQQQIWNIQTSKQCTRK